MSLYATGLNRSSMLNRPLLSRSAAEDFVFKPLKDRLTSDIVALAINWEIITAKGKCIVSMASSVSPKSSWTGKQVQDHLGY